MSQLQYPVRGEDIVLEITLKYEDDTVIDLTSLSGYKVEVFQENFLIQKFTQVAASGYTLTQETDAANGVFECRIEGENTQKAFCEKEIYYSVKIEYADTDFPDNVTMRDTGNILFAIMKESKQRNITTF